MVALSNTLIVSVGLGLALLPQASSAPTTNQQDQRALADFLLKGNQAYYDTIPFLTVKFRVNRGKAETIEDGLRGKWLPGTEPLVCRCFWAFDHENEIRRDEYQAEDIAKHESHDGKFLTRTVVNQHTLRKGNLIASYQPGQIFHIQDTSTAPPSLKWYNPLNFGRNAPLYEAARLARSQPGGSVTYEGEQEKDGYSTHVLFIRWGSRQSDRFWIDALHGYVPVRIETYYDDKKEFEQVFVVNEFRKLPGYRWIPTTYRYINLSDLSLTEMVLDEVESQEPPYVTTFELQVPMGLNGINDIKQQVLTSRSGRIALASFKPDGTLDDSRGDFGLDTTQRTTAKGLPSAPDGRESTVPVWPFASADQRTKRWMWIALGVFSIAAAATVLVRFWRRTA